ncbi:MAG: NUDIX domain-containing protein [Rhizobiaceae bacterium]
MTLGVRAVVVDEKNRILLVRHTYVEGWFLPGGGVERGETLIEAVTKELLEEASIIVTSRPRHFHAYLNFKASRFDHVSLFICDKWEHGKPWVPDMEIAEIGFFALDNLPETTTKNTKTRLNEVFENHPLNDNW